MPELTEPDAVRFLQRATFGPEQADVDRLIEIGVDAWFDEQFARTPQDSMYDRVKRTEQLGAPIWQQFLLGEDQLRKRTAYALSQIFVVSTHGLHRDSVGSYADRLEEGAFGTYRDLIESITRSSSMGAYLTYLWSSKADPETGSMPDENYAREILQLFSIGLDQLNQNGTQRLDDDGNAIATYDQDDIINLARVFTGWMPNSDDADWYTADLTTVSRLYSSEEKRFLGAVIPAETDQEESLRVALDTIDAHPNVGPFIGRQLIQRLVMSNPSPAYIGRVAAVWADDGNGVRGNLGAVTKAVLTDTEAVAPAGESGGKLREPVLRFSVITRMLGIRSTVQDWFIWSLEDSATAIGQMPYHSTSVFNFYRPGYVPPQTPLGDQGLVAPEFQILNEPSVVSWVNFVSWFIRNPIDSVSFSAMGDFTALSGDPVALVDRLALLMCARPLRDDIRQIVIDTVSSIDIANQTDLTELERVCSAITMIAASPDFLVEK